MSDKVKLSSRLYDSALNTAVDIFQYFEGDEREEMLENLRSHITAHGKLEENLKQIKEITSTFARESKEIIERAQAAEGDDNDDDDDNDGDDDAHPNALIADLNKRYGEAIENIQVDASNNNNVTKFNHQVNQLRDFLAGGQANADVNDDDVVMTRTMNVICPISKRRMVEPVQNDICRHVYDKASVSEMIKSNPKSRCPLMGCNNKEYLKMDQMTIDVLTKIFLERNP